MPAVSLRQLPEGVEFPSQLQERITYRSDKQLLEFNGFMSKTDFDRLLRLHNDLAYQRALEELFQKCTFPQTSSPESRRRPLPWIAAAIALAAVVSSVIFLGIRP